MPPLVVHWVTSGPNGIAPNYWCRTTYLPDGVRYWHKLWAPCTLAYHGEWATNSEQLKLWKGLFNCRLGVLNKTSSHMWDNWSFPMFLLRDGIIHPDVHGLLDDSWDVLQLLTQNGEVFHPSIMTCNFGMVIDWGRGSEIFFDPFPKGPYKFCYALLITLTPVTLIPVYYCNLLCYVILVLRATRRLLMVLSPLKWTWTPILPYMF